MTDDEIADFFLKEKPCRTLFAVQNLKDENTYSSNIRKHIDSTYAHTIKIIENLEELGLVESKKKGRKRMLRLTEKGSDYVEDLRQLVGDAWDGSGTVGMEMIDSGTGEE